MRANLSQEKRSKTEVDQFKENVNPNRSLRSLELQPENDLDDNSEEEIPLKTNPDNEPPQNYNKD